MRDLIPTKARRKRRPIIQALPDLAEVEDAHIASEPSPPPIIEREEE